MRFSLILALSFGLLLAFAFKNNSMAQLPVSVDEQPLPSLAPMLERITPAVVNIATRTQVRLQENPLLNDPFFRYFFNLPSRPRAREEQSLGSGVIIDAKEGYVITNHHVINKADEIIVTLRDGRQLKAKLIGSDPDTDVALIQVPAEDLVSIPLADSDKLRVGDFVVAIGNPFGLGQTVTSGIISALGRTGLSIHGYEDFIQTDASINPGNSGGALVNLRGELIGINTAILAPSGGNVGIGFAIPAHMVQQVVRQLREFGEVQRGQLGVVIQDIDPNLAQAFGLQQKQGAVIIEIQANSAAANAGLQIGDVVISINQRPIHNASDLRNQIGLLRIGEKATLTIIRDGKQQTIDVVVSGQPYVSGKDIHSLLEGATLSDEKEGVMIVELVHNSTAERAGFRKGDIIMGLNRRAVRNTDELGRWLNSQWGAFSVQVNRNDVIVTLAFR
ncbi:serine endoprotease DegQ [Thioflexithrix psekupsensis]|uniref:Serine endoprotease DegQ n=2 Tax=Thioflexithrix psekupsensis TaxID=1570016 RepID=A0A251X5J1_9GAMM|nr:serine endoprotease DegQ [Thioflexithrix psekupsensis]